MFFGELPMVLAVGFVIALVPSFACRQGFPMLSTAADHEGYLVPGVEIVGVTNVTGFQWTR